MRDALGRVGTAAIIGGTSDIGLAVARRLTEAGTDRLMLTGRDTTKLAEIAATLEAKTELASLDVAEIQSHDDAVERLFSGGDVDVAVVTAGVLVTDPTIDDAICMAQVNYVGTLSLVLRLSEAMRHQGHGQIIVLSSAGVTRPRPSNYSYGASKAAIDFATRGLSARSTPLQPIVTIVRPGFVRTKMTTGMRPTPLSSTPEEVATAIYSEILQPRRGVVWVPPSIRFLSWAMALVPDRLLLRIDR